MTSYMNCRLFLPIKKQPGGPEGTPPILFLTRVGQLLHDRLQAWEGSVDTAQELTYFKGRDGFFHGSAQQCSQGSFRAGCLGGNAQNLNEYHEMRVCS